MHVSVEALAIYRRTAYNRWQQAEQQRAERRIEAWSLARKAACVLRERFQVQRVVAFGSLVHADRFHLRSDIDIAVWGLTDANWLKPISAVRALADDIDIDLLDVTACAPDFLSVVERDRVEL